MKNKRLSNFIKGEENSPNFKHISRCLICDSKIIKAYVFIPSDFPQSTEAGLQYAIKSFKQEVKT